MCHRVEDTEWFWHSVSTPFHVVNGPADRCGHKNVICDGVDDWTRAVVAVGGTSNGWR
jgi:hypothetical protein